MSTSPPSALRRELRGVIRLATPVVAVQLGLMTMGTVDVLMLGRVSDLALGAGALGNAISFGIMWFGVGIVMSIDPLVAQAFGGERPSDISRYVSNGVVLAVLLSIPLSGLIWWSGPLLRHFGHDPDLVALVVSYQRGTVPGVVAFLLVVVMRQSLQAMSILKPALIAMAIANVFNVVANWALVFGNLGFEAYGVRGSAWATSAPRWVMCLCLAAAAWPILTRYWQLPSLRRCISPRTYAPFFRIGIPIAIQVSLEIWLFSTVAVLMGSLGTAEVAGHQIAINLASLTFMVPLGIAGAAATRVGNAIGRRDPTSARLSARVCLVLGVLVMCASATVFIVLPVPLSRLYTAEASVIAVSSVLIPIAGFFQIGDGLQVVAAGVLRGAADTRFAAFMAFLGFWVVGLPVGLSLTYLADWGPAGLWWGLTVGLSAVAVLLFWRVRQRLWGDHSSEPMPVA